MTGEQPEGGLRIESTRGSGVRCLEVTWGAIDLTTAPQFRAALEEATAAGDDLVLDLTRCPFMDSSGLSALVLLHTTLVGGPQRLVVVSPSETAPGRVLDLTLTGVITRAESVPAALALLGAPAA